MEQNNQTLEELQYELNLYKAKSVYAKVIKDDKSCDQLAKAVLAKDHETIARILDTECSRRVREKHCSFTASL